MNTDQLIDQLSQDAQPLANPVALLTGALALAWCASLAGLMLFEGAPLHHLAQTGPAALAVKLAFAATVGGLAAKAAVAAGRPGSRLGGSVAAIGLPVLILAMVMLLELQSVAAERRDNLLFGTSYWQCIASVTLASLPILGGLMLAYRRLAPTRLSLAGFLVGLSAGAFGALAFALFCHESAASFLLTAYTPAMLIPALLGALGARILLRW